MAKQKTNLRIVSDFPSDTAVYVFLQRAVDNDTYMFRQKDGGDTTSEDQAEHVTGKDPAHDKLLTLTVEHPEIEYRLLEVTG